MCASEGRRKRLTVRILFLFLLAAVWSTGLWAQEAEPLQDESLEDPTELVAVADTLPADELFPLGGPSRTVLTRLQMDWLDWLVACNEADAAGTEAAIASLLVHTQLLGMQRVPALSAAASIRAVDFAEAGDVERARLGLEAAQRIDPRRPEAAFAAARVARLDGDWMGTVGSYARGWLRTLLAPQLRYVLLHNLLLWLLVVVTLAGLLLVGVLMVVRGQVLYFDLYRFFHRYTPGAAAHLLCLVLLCWPLLLPAGLVWMAFYWTALLWSYSGKTEKVLLLALWLIVGSLPVLLTEQSRRVGLSLFAPLESIESAARGDLDGDLFNHLALLRTILPESVALGHLSADVHRKLGQLESARTLYRAVLEEEGSRQSALNDLAIYYFEASDYPRAADYFSRASEADEPNAAVMFNLSQTYSELYRFSESEEALFGARDLDSDSVNVWLQSEGGQRVVALDGGLGRVGEIRSELRAQWRVGEEPPTWFGHWRRALSLPLVIVLILIAVVVRLVVRRGRSVQPAKEWWSSRLDLVRKVLLTGVPEAEEGRPLRAAAALLALVTLATVPLVSALGYRLPWLHEPPQALLPSLSVVGLLLFFFLRFLRYSRDDR
jgi:tetratricopeptide (TPR) repeat protein